MQKSNVEFDDVLSDTNIKRWQTLFDLSSEQAEAKITSHFSGLDRCSISDEYWATVQEEQEALGHDKETCAFFLGKKDKKKADARIQVQNQASRVPKAKGVLKKTWLFKMTAPRHCRKGPGRSKTRLPTRNPTRRGRGHSDIRRGRCLCQRSHRIPPRAQHRSGVHLSSHPRGESTMRYKCRTYTRLRHYATSVPPTNHHHKRTTIDTAEHVPRPVFLLRHTRGTKLSAKIVQSRYATTYFAHARHRPRRQSEDVGEVSGVGGWLDVRGAE